MFLMRKLTVCFGFAVAVAMGLGVMSSPAGDIALGDDVLATSFGGWSDNIMDGTPVSGKCCLADPGCTVVTSQCKSSNGMTEAICLASNQIILQPIYANQCRAPVVGNSGYSCTNYAKDTTGQTRYCVSVFSCT